MTSTLRTAACTAFLVVLTATAVWAQQPQRVRGTLESVDGGLLTVKGNDGSTMKIKLADNAPVRAVVKASLSDIKPGSFIGVTGMPQPDGSQKAVEVHIFPEAMRGTGEGFRPWDLMPNSTMTNATVDNQVANVDGQTLTLKYKDGVQKITVSPTAAIVTYAPATAADLKPGEKVFVAAAAKQPDGTLTAPNITVGRNGVSPPM
jgi:Domain of unknown function (DUF5666)